MKPITKFFSILVLATLFTSVIAGPALAFDGRTGDQITIEKGEVVKDDLYVTAQVFTLDGTVEGDLTVFGETIIINGTVNGDLIAAGQSIVINGEVTGSARIAGAALQLGKSAVIGEDLVAGGASLETRDGSAIGRDLVFGTGQSLLSGDVADDVLAGTGALEIRGAVGGDVKVEVGDASQAGPSPSTYINNTSISIPSVPPGLTIGDEARISGDLSYTQSKDIHIPEGVVIGKVTRSEPSVRYENTYVPPTPAQLAAKWVLNLFRTMVTLILLGLILGWLAPNFVQTLIEKTRTNPAANLGWGLVAYAAYFFALLVIIVAMVAGGLFFGVLTLGGIGGSIVWIGLLLIFALTIAFVLATSFLTKIIVAWLGGRMIFQRLNPALADHKIWPLVLGVVILALLMALPLIGWVFSLLVVLLGLGALWMFGLERWQTRKAG